MRCSRPLLPARGLSSFFVVKPGSHPYVLHPPHPPVHTKLAGPFTTLPAHDADATLHRAPAMPAHTRTRTLLSLTRDRYIHTNYKLTLFRTCAVGALLSGREG